MKKYLVLLLVQFYFWQSWGQNVIIQNGSSLKTFNNVYIVLADAGLNNQGAADFSGSTLILRGASDVVLNSVSDLAVPSIVVDKPNAKVILGNHLHTSTSVNFLNGLLDLGGKNIYLSPTASIIGETETAHITGSTGGEVILTLNLNAPNNVNPGNLGAFITSFGDLGNVTIKRGHQLQSGNGLTAGINRYYDIQPTNNIGLKANLLLNYLDAELNALDETTLVLLESSNSGTSWQQKNASLGDTNTVAAQNLASLYRYTLGTTVNTPSPATTFDFYAKRTDANNVQLDWTSTREVNNYGFYIERRKETEPDFTSIGFVPSKAVNGNSTSPLSYTWIDANSFTGKTYYRLMQQGFDKQTTYSMIRMVTGKTKGNVKLTAFPIPAQGEFNVTIEGIDEGIVQLYDLSGRLIKQATVYNEQPVKMTNIPPGSYILTLASQPDVNLKIVVQ